jgi:hypothetical protein
LPVDVLGRHVGLHDHRADGHHAQRRAVALEVIAVDDGLSQQLLHARLRRHLSRRIDVADDQALHQVSLLARVDQGVHIPDPLDCRDGRLGRVAQV